ncbi:MAG: hypothetical protein IT303_10830 [Dehalococcoidia bacterium]|nr:hypothetical protein [Dehalococcoidia bacterium]
MIADVRQIHCPDCLRFCGETDGTFARVKCHGCRRWLMWRVHEDGQITVAAGLRP